MKLKFDSLAHCQHLQHNGVASKQFEAITEGLTTMQIANLYSKEEIDALVPESVKTMVREERALRAQYEKEASVRQQARRKEIADNLRDIRKESRAERQQALQQSRNEWQQWRQEMAQDVKMTRRWLLGTLVSGIIGMAAYLSLLVDLLLHYH